MPKRSNLLTRPDTMLGICEGLGEDLGFNPLWLRCGLAVLLYANPAAAVGGYAACGVIVLVSRLVFPAPRSAAAPAIIPPTVAQTELEAMPLAA